MRKTEAYDIVAEFAEKISAPEKFEFDEVVSVMEKTGEALDEFPDLYKYVDTELADGINYHYDSDFHAEYLKILLKVMSKKDTKQQIEYLQKLRETEHVDEIATGELNLQIAMLPDRLIMLYQAENELAFQNPDLLDDVFSHKADLLSKICSPNYEFEMMKLVCRAPNAQKCKKMLERIFNKKVPEIHHNRNMRLIGEVYKKYPELIDDVFNIVKRERNNTYYFSALADIALFDEIKAEEALSYMHSRAQGGPKTSFLLQKYYIELKRVSDNLPKLKPMAQEFCREALVSPENSKNCRKLAGRLLEDEKMLSSHICVGKEVEKSTSFPHGYKTVKDIDGDEICILFIGGNGAEDNKAAHGYIKPAIELLAENGLKNKVQVYGLAYDFGDYFNTDQALEAQMKEYGHRPVKQESFLDNMQKDTQNPQFIKQIFNQFILPRISRLDGKVKLPAEEAAKKMNKLKIMAHCFGGYVSLKLEEMSLQTMQKLGYTPQEQSLIQGQLQVIGLNPYCPLGVQKSDMFSIISAQDRKVTHNNFFEKYVRHVVNKGKIIPLCYFERKLGNFVLVNKMYGSDNRRNDGSDKDEHNYFGLKISPVFSVKGRMAMKFVQNALINGLKSGLRDEIRSLDTEKLITSDEEDRYAFADAKENGKAFYKQVVDYTLSENAKVFEKNQKKSSRKR